MKFSKLSLEVLLHEKQRYNTVGDWYYEDGVLKIRSSDYGDWRMESAVILHELTEAIVCRMTGVTQKMVDDFDFAYANDRPANDTSEPADHPLCPYRRQHQFATVVEKMVCMVLFVSWKVYLQRTDELMLTYPTTAS